MIKCGNCSSTFINYSYQRVFWSADTIPCCPVCGVNSYDPTANFTYHEDYTYENKEENK
jgi:hypothetical protein